MKNTAEYCKYKNNNIEILFSKYILEKIYNDHFTKINLGGIECNNCFTAGTILNGTSFIIFI